VATGDFDGALRKMFGVRGESKRIDAAEKLGLPENRRSGLNPSQTSMQVPACRLASNPRNESASRQSEDLSTIVRRTVVLPVIAVPIVAVNCPQNMLLNENI
jgi:hypothetical protein